MSTDGRRMLRAYGAAAAADTPGSAVISRKSCSGSPGARANGR